MRTLVLHTIVGVLATAVVTEACAWTPRKQIDIPPRTSTTAVNMKLFDGITDFMENFDDVVDDFMNKRMGNGEIFYGKRKYKPSGKPNTEGRYNGMGMSDKTKIDFARQFKEEFLERKKQMQEKEERK